MVRIGECIRPNVRVRAYQKVKCVCRKDTSALVSLRSIKTLVEFVVTGAANEVATIRYQLDDVAKLCPAEGTSECLLVGIERILHSFRTRMKIERQKKTYLNEGISSFMRMHIFGVFICVCRYVVCLPRVLLKHSLESVKAEQGFSFLNWTNMLSATNQ